MTFKNPMPPLSEARREALKADIQKRGLMVPIEVDADTGDILDGQNRADICAELGIEPQQVRRSFVDNGARIEHALKLNLLRRQMDDETWTEAFKTLAEVRGVRLGSGGDQTAKVAVRSDDLAAELGVAPRTARRRRQNAKKIAILRTKAPDLAEKVKEGDIDLRRAERIARERDAASKSATASADMPATVDLRIGDFRTALADLTNVDAIITDPPYEAAADDLYPELVRLASRILKPTGTLVVLCGTRPDAWLRRLPLMKTDELPLRWVGCYLTHGASYRDHTSGIATNWKPLLIFGGTRNLNTDVFRSSGDDKAHHAWGQNEDAFAKIVAAFSDPGDLIVDPFLGGGTTAVVSHGQGRRFIGCDIDEAAVSAAQVRFA